jgi:hypothetical protein
MNIQELVSNYLLQHYGKGWTDISLEEYTELVYNYSNTGPHGLYLEGFVWKNDSSSIENFETYKANFYKNFYDNYKQKYGALYPFIKQLLNPPVVTYATYTSSIEFSESNRSIDIMRLNTDIENCLVVNCISGYKVKTYLSYNAVIYLGIIKM